MGKLKLSTRFEGRPYSSNWGRGRGALKKEGSKNGRRQSSKGGFTFLSSWRGGGGGRRGAKTNLFTNRKKRENQESNRVPHQGSRRERESREVRG